MSLRRLRHLADRLQYRPQSAYEVIEAGNVLTEAKSLLPHGGFRRWVAQECGWSYQAVTNCLACQKAFGKVRKNILCFFEISALVALSARTCSNSSIQKALHLASKGHRITWTEAQKILGRWEEKSKPLKPTQKADTIDELLTRFDTLTITKDVDAENGEIVYSTMALDAKTGKRRSSAGARLKLVLAAVTGDEPVKVCSGCRRPLVLSQYSVLQDSEDGYNHRCKQCERDRVNDAYRRGKRPKRIDSHQE